MKTVLGIFSDRGHAEDAVNDLEEEGFRPQDISIVMRDRGEGEQLAHNTGANVAGGAATGATTGAVVGGIAGLLIGIGAIAIPGIGPLLIGGPLAAALGLTGAAASTATGAVTGAVAGGLLGALVSLGIPEEDAKVYEEKIREGGILVAVPASDRSEEIVRDIMSRDGAEQIRAIRTTPARRADDYEDEEGYEHIPSREYTSGGAYYTGAKGGRSSGPLDEDYQAAGDDSYSDEDTVPDYDEPDAPIAESEYKGGRQTHDRGWFEKPRSRTTATKRRRKKVQ